MKAWARVTLYVVTLVVLVVHCYAINPPKGLEWGMSYEKLKVVLKNPEKGDPPKVKKLSKNHKTRVFYPEHHLPEGYRWTSLEEVKLLDKKVDDAIAVFDSDGGLTDLQYQFRIITGDGTEVEKMWAYYQKLSDALKKKYGKPDRDQVTPTDFGVDIPAATYLETVWVDNDTGSQVRVLVTVFKIGGGLLSSTNHYVILEYSSKLWLENQLKKVLDEDL